MLTVGDRRHDELSGNAIATNQLDHDVDIRMANHSPTIGHYLDRTTRHLFGAFGVKIGHHHHFDGPAGAAPNFFLITAQYIKGATTYRADT